MITPCPDCGYKLWSEVRSVGAFRFVVYFDDDEGSATYAESVRSCPSCASWLDDNALEPHGLARRG